MHNLTTIVRNLLLEGKLVTSLVLSCLATQVQSLKYQISNPILLAVNQTCSETQVSTIIIKSLYVIKYEQENFGVREVSGKYQKTYIRRENFYLVIFLTIFLKLVLI